MTGWYESEAKTVYRDWGREGGGGHSEWFVYP